MGKVVVVNNITLDGVMQAPARADEDTRNGFKYGGWGIPFNDPVMGKKMAELMAKGSPHGALLLGREPTRISTQFGPNEKMAILIPSISTK